MTTLAMAAFAERMSRPDQVTPVRRLVPQAHRACRNDGIASSRRPRGGEIGHIGGGRVAIEGEWLGGGRKSASPGLPLA
jgi:hypothetical protein